MDTSTVTGSRRGVSAAPFHYAAVVLGVLGIVAAIVGSSAVTVACVVAGLVASVVAFSRPGFSARMNAIGIGVLVAAAATDLVLNGVPFVG